MLEGYTIKLAEIIQNIESNELQIKSHKTSASVANTIALASYLLTSNSKNKITRSVGQIGAVGGLIYGSGETSKAKSLKEYNLQLIASGVRLIMDEASKSYRSERVLEVRGDFLKEVLKLSLCLDLYVKEHLSVIRRMNSLTRNNRRRLMNLDDEPIFKLKLALNDFLLSVDESLVRDKIVSDYKFAVRGLVIKTVEKESFLALVIIFGCLLAGLFVVFKEKGAQNVGVVLLMLSVVFYSMHTFFPVFAESRRLRRSVKNFCLNIEMCMGIRSINIR